MSKSAILTAEEAGEIWQDDQVEDLKQEFAMFFCEHWPGNLHLSVQQLYLRLFCIYFLQNLGTN